MKREIKFRVFDEFTKKMYYEVELVKKDDGYWWAWENGLLLNGSESTRRFVMQYIELKDKNDKDIYEGDIVRVKNPHVRDFEDSNPTLRIIQWFEEEARFSFYWLDGTKQGSGWSFCKNILSDSEIIGNIYENPKLLEATE